MKQAFFLATVCIALGISHTVIASERDLKHASCLFLIAGLWIQIGALKRAIDK